MIENFIPADFISRHTPCRDPKPRDLIFYFRNSDICLLDNNQVPEWQHLTNLLSSDNLYCFGQLNEQRCLIAVFPESLPEEFIFKPVRYCYELLGNTLYRIAGFACQLFHWRINHVYCGQCGAKNQDKNDERALICSRCDALSYPNFYPCIIVLVTKGPELLLARSPHFQPGVYSTLAGFIEPGESVENAVHREVKEEVNITVKNIRYTCSQPWPFPNSLMLGFFAEYESGDIKIDPAEIEDARWFQPHLLPVLPSPLGISKFLIEKHLQKQKV
jgi:NAD+ diphosphatase